QSRQSAQEIEEQYQSDRQMITFPAGLCSRKLKGGKIGDLEWKKFVVTHAVSSQRDIIPIYFDGQNSKKFYRLARLRERLGIKLNIEMIMLPGEMFKSNGNTYKVYFGKPIKWQDLDTKNARGEAARLRNIVYELKKS
ncbi:MAG: glycerol acyltransferase, partial [Muribaculaceae bacterium]|nr:glycerol acyltransferase [Muribaculaceae bacterium]